EYRTQNIGLKQKLLNSKFYQQPTNKKAFTLVELIVVIVILAILGTIAFISFQGYSKNSRDSVRIADINNLEKSLGIYVVKTGFYPIPDNSTEITYLGGTAWVEGTIGETVMRNIDSVSKKPIDPLTANEYTYSITTSKKEYEIGTINEGSELTQNLTPKTYAATNLNDKRAVVKGTYNQKILKVSTGGINYILAVPSILATDLSNPTIENIIQEKKLVYNNYNNIPHSYNPTGTTQTGGFNFQSNKLEVYSGAIIDFDNNTNKVTFLTNLKEAYNGTILQGEEAYKDITNIDPQTEQDKAVNLVNNYITNNVGGISGKITTVTYNNCTLDGQTIEHNQTITAYSENSILYGASYDCIDRAEDRTCNNGVLSGDTNYQYKTCVKGTPTNCSANSNYTYNTHIYSIPAINHSETATNINSQIVNISNGTQVYKLTSIGCNDGVLVNETEDLNPTVTCNSGYSVVGTACIQNTCATQPTYTHASYTIGTPTQPNQIRQNTNSGNPCYYACTDSYTGNNCEIAPIVQWKDIPGTNCTNDDITIGGKVWAGCNSVLGTTGISTNANVYNGTCYNYTGGITTTNCSSTYLTYTAKENDYNVTYGENNIWGKLYLWSNLTTACKNPIGGNFSNTTASTTDCPCPTGWHVPTEQEFLNMEIALTCTDSSVDLNWRCDGLGFSGKTLKTPSNNIIKALKLPLAGYRYSDIFYNRGVDLSLWSSTEYNSFNARGRYLSWVNSTVHRNGWSKSTVGFSVRCIKD
ncbi:MAG: FISUMP domain-containing protein, partial [Candidatus Gracilibacteria bacterium]|nr:FISUMP domain-containing protein [Candidatus Gracilibacteria bacterium]